MSLTPLSGCRKRSASPEEQATITVYGFSILREPLEKEIFPAFQEQWRKKTGQSLIFASSYAGSEIVTNQILQGVNADIAILAIERDAERLRAGGATKTDWRQYPHQGIVNRTPFVILVRKGNPKGIRDFSDLARPGVKIIHPDPTSSGGGQWSIVTLYGAELLRAGMVPEKRNPTAATALLRGIWKNVIATPGSAREARTQFEAGFGDALVTYEVEALQLLRRKAPVEVIYPARTMFSEHPVVIIDQDMTQGKRALVELFLAYLWSEEAQRAWVKYHFRAITDERLNAAESKFRPIEHPFSIADLGGWRRAYPEIIEAVWKNQIKNENQDQ
ncbi:MAG: substrate-binding domain-containing protein [Blastocatellia bacterium]